MGGSIAALEDPFQNAAVLAVSRPQKSLFIFAKPVHVKNPGQLGPVGGSNLQPVSKVIAHVVSTKREHGHGIAAKLSHLARRGSGRFAAGRGTEEYAVLPVE